MRTADLEGNLCNMRNLIGQSMRTPFGRKILNQYGPRGAKYLL